MGRLNPRFAAVALFVVLALVLPSVGNAAGGGRAALGVLGTTGPEHWGQIAPEFKSVRDRSAPVSIDITTAVDEDLPALTLPTRQVA